MYAISKKIRIFDHRNKHFKHRRTKIMANKRNLKHGINLFCDELLAECIAASLYGQNRSTAEALVFSTVQMRNDFIRRISHPEPGMDAKQYFKVLKDDFMVQAAEIIDQLNNNH